MKFTLWPPTSSGRKKKERQILSGAQLEAWQ
jgi:hypothetical protein